MKFGKLLLVASTVLALAAGTQIALGDDVPELAAAAEEETAEAQNASLTSDEADESDDADESDEAAGENGVPDDAQPPEPAHPQHAARPEQQHGPAHTASLQIRVNAVPAARPGFPDSELPPPPPNAFSKEEAGLIKSVFTMSDAELRNLRMLIERLERIPAEQRRRLAADLERASQDMTKEQRENYMKDVRERFRKTQSNLLARYFASLSPQQADAERRKFLSLDASGRRHYLAQIREKMGYEAVPAADRGSANGKKSAGTRGKKRKNAGAQNPQNAQNAGNPPADAGTQNAQNPQNAPADAQSAPADVSAETPQSAE